MGMTEDEYKEYVKSQEASKEADELATKLGNEAEKR